MNKYVIALYLRLSVDDKISDSLSIENQRNLLNTYVKDMLEHRNTEILEFVDNGYSGTNFKRPAMQELLSLIKSNSINCIIVKDFSRFGRNILEVGYFTEKVFPTLGIRFISVSDKFDSHRYKNDTGGISIAFQYLINEYYSKDLSKKVKSSVYSKMKNGKYKTSFSPYGYTKDNEGYLNIDEESAEIVRFIFNQALKVNKITDLPKKLNDKGIKTPSQYKKQNNCNLHSNAKDIQLWTVQSVKKILKNEFYIGTFIGKRYKTKEVGGSALPNYDENEYIKIKNHHPQIIDDDIFYKVQKIIVNQKSKSVVKNHYSLRNKVKCGVCNHALARVNKEKTFKCKYTQNAQGYSCKGMKILESELEDIILTIIKKQAELILAIKPNEIENMELLKINNLKEKRLSIEREKIQLYERFVRNEILLEDYKRDKNLLDKFLLEIDYKQKSIYVEDDAPIKNNVANLIKDAISKDQLSRELVEVLIDKIYVYPNKKIKVLWGLQEFYDVK